jgi:hypothetical protein
MRKPPPDLGRRRRHGVSIAASDDLRLVCKGCRYVGGGFPQDPALSVLSLENAGEQIALLDRFGE